jgi:hypothetical protein
VNISQSGAGAQQAISGADASSGFTVAVAKKALNNTKLEGQMAVGLIEAAGKPPAPTASRGNAVNTYA